MKALYTADPVRARLFELALSDAKVADQRMLGAAHEKAKKRYQAWATAPETIGPTLKHSAPEEWAAHERQWQERGESLEFLREVAPKAVQRYEGTTAAIAVAAHEFARAYPDSWAKAAGLLAAEASAIGQRREGSPPQTARG